MDISTWNSILIGLITGVVTLIGLNSAVKNLKEQLAQEKQFHLTELKNKLYTDSILSFSSIPSVIANFTNFDIPLEDSQKVYYEQSLNLTKLQLLTDTDILEKVTEYNDYFFDAFLDLAKKRLYIKNLNMDEIELAKIKLDFATESHKYIIRLSMLGGELTLKLKTDFGYPSINETKYLQIISDHSIHASKKLVNWQNELLNMVLINKTKK